MDPAIVADFILLPPDDYPKGEPHIPFIYVKYRNGMDWTIFYDGKDKVNGIREHWGMTTPKRLPRYESVSVIEIDYEVIELGSASS